MTVAGSPSLKGVINRLAGESSATHLGVRVAFRDPCPLGCVNMWCGVILVLVLPQAAPAAPVAGERDRATQLVRAWASTGSCKAKRHMAMSTIDICHPFFCMLHPAPPGKFGVNRVDFGDNSSSQLIVPIFALATTRATEPAQGGTDTFAGKCGVIAAVLAPASGPSVPPISTIVVQGSAGDGAPVNGFRSNWTLFEIASNTKVPTRASTSFWTVPPWSPSRFPHVHQPHATSHAACGVLSLVPM